MNIERTSVGLDVHARSVVGCAIDNDTGEIHRRRLTPDPVEILAWTSSLPGPVRVIYEAGPTGFGLARAFLARGIECVIAAPSKLQRPTGDRVKTDAKDALHLAKLLRLGEIVAVTIPSEAQEAARDLVRAREDTRADLMRYRHRLSKLLLRQGIVYSDGHAWTATHEAWLHRQRFALAGRQGAYDAALEAVILTQDRRDRLDVVIDAMATNSQYSDVVNRLCCLRGISTLTGFALAVEIGDWHRLSGSSIASYVGLVPSESSSGTSRQLGSITKTGNGHVRRLLVEAARHHRKIYTSPGAVMRARGHEGNHRLHHRWLVFTERQKKPVVANVAVARELAGWCWSLAVLEWINNPTDVRPPRDRDLRSAWNEPASHLGAPAPLR